MYMWIFFFELEMDIMDSAPLVTYSYMIGLGAHANYFHSLSGLELTNVHIHMLSRANMKYF